MRWTLTFVMGFASLGTACLDVAGDCENNIVAELVSPDSVKRAVVFSRECGATTGSSTQVSIIAVGSELSDSPGNIFIADDTASRGGLGVQLRWATSDTLEIRLHDRLRVFTREREQSGVTIRVVVD